jgi:probable F420-dependent oxidoreductase
MKIGFVVLTTEYTGSGRIPRYTEVRAMAQRAEDVGFDSIWLNDHFLYRYKGQSTTGIWECWTILAALAEATQRVEIGTLVTCNAFRNPAILAKMATTLDEVSGGRATLGIGAGWNKPEFEAIGAPFRQRVARLEEALQIIQPLLKKGQVDFNGRYYQARHCENLPPGPREQAPLLLVGGAGKRMMRLAAKYADMWNQGYLGQPGFLIKRSLARLKAACEEVGRDPQTLAVTVLVALAYPELARPPGFMFDYLTGSTEDLVSAFVAYEQLGVSHLMVHCSPYSVRTMTRLVEGVQAYRKI